MKKTPPVLLKKNDQIDNIDFEAGTALLIDKPPGITSFGVVNRVRKLLKVKKVGHAGTLDPAATGLLILLTGKGTRSQDDFMGLDKEYLATILMGVETTTRDMDGEVISRKPVPDIYRSEFENLLKTRFTGEFNQTPPAFSAIKQNGVPAYKRARQGQKVELKPRRVRVDRIEITRWELPEITFMVKCSSGFYVRSLAHDIGEAQQCGAALKKLIRTQIGPHRLEDAFNLDEFAELVIPCPN